MGLKENLRGASRNLARLEKACKDWDFAAFGKYAASLRHAMQEVAGEWECGLHHLDSEIAEDEQHLASEAYRGELERYLQEDGVPFTGEFPNYELPPFKLEVDVKNRAIRLLFGRRTERCTSLAPPVAAKWTASRYKRIVESPFDSERFSHNLLAAYEITNRLTYRNENVVWGHAVPLAELYRLFTLRRESRRDYPREMFMYDLTRLRQGPLVFDGRRFEFGYSRDVGKTLLLLDPRTGRDERLSSLTIHEKGG